LRRQLARPFRKPLVVMTPKSLLRHPEVVSDLTEFKTGTKFHEVIDDPLVGARSGKKVKKLLLCTGKIYYDLMARKKEENRDDVAIVRLEQLYPLPDVQLQKIFKRYPNAVPFWVQEEPSNMGAWQYVYSIVASKEVGLNADLNLISRKSSASPATGYKKVHDQQQIEIVNQAFS